MWAQFRSWLYGLLQRPRVERDMADEMEFHLAARAEALARRGLTPAEAARQARLEFGALDNYKEQARQSFGLRWIDELGADCRYGWRQLRKTPAFTILAIAILAIGIGANAAMFNAIDAVMLRMLPVQQPEQLRHLGWTARRSGFHRSYSGTSFRNDAGEKVAWSVSYPVYQYLRDHTATFTGLFAFGGGMQLNLAIHGHAQLAYGESVSGNYFTTLGTSAMLGRVFTQEDDQLGGMSSVAVLSHGFWQRAFGGERGVLGQAVVINGTPIVVVGVLPQGFCGVNPQICPDVFFPIAMYERLSATQNVLRTPHNWNFEVMGRMKPDVADERARAEIEALIHQAILDYKPRDEYDPPRITLHPAGNGINRLRSDLERPLTVLAWTVGIVLLIACANIAGLLLARATARQREIGTRLALGAGRWRLIRQLLTESVMLSVAGGIVGAFLARLVGDSVVRLFIRDERPLGIASTADLRVLLFSGALCLLTGAVFGLLPALRATRVDLLPMLKTTGATADRSRFRIGKILIAIQVALSLILITGSALFIRTLVNLRSESLGFRPENLLMFKLNPELNGYRNQRLLDFHENVIKRLANIPGVRSASMSRHGILTGSLTADDVKVPGKKDLGVYIHYVAPRFLEANGIPLLTGRDVSFADRETSLPIVLINETLAKRLFPEQNPLGQTIQIGDVRREVVGLVGDARYSSLRNAIPPTIYIPFRQNRQFQMTYVVRSETDPKRLVNAARRTVESIDPNVPLYEIKTQTEQINQLIRRERVFAYLISTFALLAMTLACLGIYGTLAYLVSRRTPEIGVRMALGAQRSDVVSLVLRESTWAVIVGVAAGIAGTLAAGRLVESMLFGLEPRDPATLFAAGLLLIGTALLAAWLPALRASRIEPMAALRHE